MMYESTTEFNFWKNQIEKKLNQSKIQFDINLKYVMGFK